MNFLLDNPFVQKWIALGRRETQPLRIASSRDAARLG